MGREVRKIPANWEHPTKENGEYDDLRGDTFEKDYAEWDTEKEAWLRGERPDFCSEECPSTIRAFIEWNGEAPNPDYYCNYEGKEPTLFALYQNVSEGTPLTPAFPTLKELEDYLVISGADFDGRYTREEAHRICQGGYAPTLMGTLDNLKPGWQL